MPQARDPEALRKKILDDPNTARIAEELGVPLEEYVEQVLFYAMNPQAEPQLYVVEDADLRAMGVEPPDPDAMGKYLIEAVTLAEAHEKTEFIDSKKQLVQLSDNSAQPLPEGNEELKSEVEKVARVGRVNES